MASSGGHWATLAALKELGQAQLIPGVMEGTATTFRGGLLPVLPFAQAKGTSIKWNETAVDRRARNASVGQELTWVDNVSYTQRETELVTIYDQTPLNKFVSSIYDTVNNYEGQQLIELTGSMVRRLEDQIIYGDATYGTKQFDGLHAWAEIQSGNLDIDEGEGALSLTNMRALRDAMKNGIDFWLVPYAIAARFDELLEIGVGSSIPLGVMQRGIDQFGKPVLMYGGIPIIRSDYLVSEQANTGVGSDIRAKNSSGTANYSIFAVKMGQVMAGQPGLTMGFGGDANALGQPFRMERFDKLEDFDAAGLRLTGYFGMLAGGPFAVGRIYDVTDAAITA
jgi:hypothetical protein